MRRATTTNYELSQFEEFQSTLSMRRATTFDHYYPVTIPISIHALHEESDLTRGDADARYVISIHALHEESDPPPRQSLRFVSYFNPRSP